MSAKVGRVGYVFKGDYNNLTEYSRLNCVKHTDGNIYVAKGDTVGNLPTNSTYWDLFLRGVNNASDLAYDNTVSGLTADDVQEAIDELASEKQDTLTFDASPTEDSTNPVTSGGVYTALGNKQDTLTFDNSPTENSANPVKSGGVYSAIEDVQDYAEDNIAAIVNVYSAKNILSYPYRDTTKTESGITFTDNGDGTVTIGSGTASANVTFDFKNRAYDYYTVEDGDYIISGCPEGGHVYRGYYLYATYKDSNDAWVEADDVGEGASLSVRNSLEGKDATKLSIGILINKDTVISTPITFKPMIRDARITNPTYVPYAMTNRELTEKCFGKDMPVVQVNSSVSSSYTTISYIYAECEGKIPNVGMSCTGICNWEAHEVLLYTITRLNSTDVYISMIGTASVYSGVIVSGSVSEVKKMNF